MSLRPDHKALVFVGAIAVLGAGVRVMRAATGANTVSAQPALDHQLAAADSARTQQSRGKSAKGRGKPKAGRGSAPQAARQAPPKGKLDLDVATAAQLDSLPGVSPTMARRIVADRMARGPFTSKDGMRRVTGVGPGFLKQIDTLVTFSGTVAPPSPADTVIPTRKKGRGRAASAPP